MITWLNSWWAERTSTRRDSRVSAPSLALGTGFMRIKKSWLKSMAETTFVRDPISIPTNSVDR
jgi:hypothetical protein